MSGSSFSELYREGSHGLQEILVAFIVYSILVSAAELTFGNPKFIFNLWTFENIDPWKWSLPVHFIGFFWILLVNAILKNKPMIFAIMGSVLFCGRDAQCSCIQVLCLFGSPLRERIFFLDNYLSVFFPMCA